MGKNVDASWEINNDSRYINSQIELKRVLKNETFNINDLLHYVMGIIVKSVGAEAGVMWLTFSFGVEQIYPIVTLGDVDLRGASLYPGEGIVGNVIETGAGILVKDCQKHPRWAGKVDVGTGFIPKSMICVPMKHENSIVGCIQMINHSISRKFNESEFIIISKLAEEVATSVNLRSIKESFNGNFSPFSKDAVNGLNHSMFADEKKEVTNKASGGKSTETIKKIRTIENALNKVGLACDNGEMPISDINIVIGKNGAGKSRLINAVYTYYGKKAIMCDFTKLKPQIASADEMENEPRNIDLWDFLRYHDSIDVANLFEEIQNGCYEYIETLIKKSNGGISPLRKCAKAAIENLKKNIAGLLDYDLDIQEKNQIYFIDHIGNKTPFYEKINSFSPGELVIFYIAIFRTFYESDERVTDEMRREQFVLILDEPECHLHAEALRKLIHFLVDEKKKKNNRFSQIWIATHSLFVIPEFEFENIVYVRDGHIKSKNGDTYFQIKKDLLGEDKEDLIGSFFSSIPEWMYAKFIGQCFETPEVIENPKPGDPQIGYFKKFLSEAKLKQAKPEVLDFGGGKERLRRAIEDEYGELPFEYSICDTNIINPDNDYRFKDIKKTPKSKFDCVIAMNVFHEINPDSWNEIFHDIFRCLKDDGILLLIEAIPLSKGEQPEGTPGYFVLTDSAARKLFGVQKEDADYGVLAGNVLEPDSHKVLGIPILKKYLSRVSEESVLESIRIIGDNAWEYVSSKIKSDDSSDRRAYAFYLQQYANSKFYFAIKEPQIAIKEPQIAIKELKTARIKAEPKREWVEDYWKYFVSDLKVHKAAGVVYKTFCEMTEIPNSNTYQIKLVEAVYQMFYSDIHRKSVVDSQILSRILSIITLKKAKNFVDSQWQTPLPFSFSPAEALKIYCILRLCGNSTSNTKELLLDLYIHDQEGTIEAMETFPNLM